jgi:hypothetical protein
MNLQSIRLDPDGQHLTDSLRMLDISKGGIGAMSEHPFYPGQRVLLAIPASSGRGRLATVTRCRQLDEGYRVGLEFDTPPAMAAAYGFGAAMSAAA